MGFANYIVCILGANLDVWLWNRYVFLKEGVRFVGNGILGK